jgi:hypothetical protein
MAIINIFSKPRNGRATVIHTMEVADDFNAAVEACRAFSLTLPKTTAKIFWNWADSAWGRTR